jgi:hypothetical protein
VRRPELRNTYVMTQPDGDTGSPEERPPPTTGEQVGAPGVEPLPAPVAPGVEEQPQSLSLDQRRQLFASTLQAQVATGGRIESQDHFHAVIQRDRRPKRALHLSLTIFTGGLWGLVWLPLALVRRSYRKRQVVEVDEFGLVTIQPAEGEMGAEISGILGAPHVAGAFVGPKGQTRGTIIGAAGTEVGGVYGWIGRTVGGFVAHLAVELFSLLRGRRKHKGETSQQGGGAPALPPLHTSGYVAVSPDEVVVVQVLPGLRRLKVGPGVVGRVPRSAVASAELDRGRWVSVLRIGFVDGGWSEFEVPRIQRDTAEQVVHALGGRVS